MQSTRLQIKLHQRNHQNLCLFSQRGLTAFDLIASSLFENVFWPLVHQQQQQQQDSKQHMQSRGLD